MSIYMSRSHLMHSRSVQARENFNKVLELEAGNEDAKKELLRLKKAEQKV